MTEHLEKLLLGMLEKLMVRAFGKILELGTEKLKQIKKMRQCITCGKTRKVYRKDT